MSWLVEYIWGKEDAVDILFLAKLKGLELYWLYKETVACCTHMIQFVKFIQKPLRCAQFYLQCFDEHFNVEIGEAQRDPKHGRENDEPQQCAHPHLEDPKHHIPACSLHFTPGSSQSGSGGARWGQLTCTERE